MILTPVRRGQTQTAEDRDYWAVVDAWAAKRWGPRWRRYVSDEAAAWACAGCPLGVTPADAGEEA